MENDNTYKFITINGQPVIATERNIKMTYTLIRERKLGRLVINYERVLICKTARARVVYFGYNNRVAKFKRAFVPAANATLRNYGINISIAR